MKYKRSFYFRLAGLYIVYKLYIIYIYYTIFHKRSEATKLILKVAVTKLVFVSATDKTFIDDDDDDDERHWMMMMMMMMRDIG